MTPDQSQTNSPAPNTEERSARTPKSAASDLSALIGKPYTPAHDCNWLARRCAEHFGLVYPAIETPHDKDDYHACIEQALSQHYRQIRNPSPGSVAIYCTIMQGRQHWHIGTILDGQWMMTTVEKTGVIKARYRLSPWARLCRGYYTALEASA